MLQRLRHQFRAGKEAEIEIYFLMVKWAVIQATNTRNIEIVMLCGQARRLPERRARRGAISRIRFSIATLASRDRG